MLRQPPGLLSDQAEVSAAFAPLAQARGLLLAVSGGSDSLALMVLAARWARGMATPPPLFVATVDHGLREESAAEAEAVARQAAALGLPHATLVWQGRKPSSGLQEAAREARYRLLSVHAHAVGASHVATGHHAEDQAETVLMRLAAGSGIGGLGGMPAISGRGGIVIARPLLRFPKASLIAVCREAGFRPLQDPSNSDPRFARARWRAAAPQLAALGLTTETIGRLAARARRADEALAVQAASAFARLPKGEGWADVSSLPGEPEEVGLRVLGRLVEAAGGRPVRLERLEALHGRLREALVRGEALRATLAGLTLRVDGRGNLQIAPEPPRRRGARQDTAAARNTPSLGKAAGEPYIDGQDQSYTAKISGPSGRVPSPPLSNGEHETVQE